MIDPTPVEMLVLRHGRSEWNAVRRWQGSFDSPLDEVGRGQAAAVAGELVRLDVEWATPVASPLGRAYETASIIAARLGLPEPSIDARFAEAHAGEWQGMTPDEIEAEYPGWLAAHRRPPGFEPFESVVARASAAVADIASVTPWGRTALVVSHSGLIRSVVRSLGIRDTRIPNLGGVWFRVSDGASATGHPRIEVDRLFDPDGIAVSGVDAPGEDPGEQPDQPDRHGRDQR